MRQEEMVTTEGGLESVIAKEIRTRVTGASRSWQNMLDIYPVREWSCRILILRDTPFHKRCVCGVLLNHQLAPVWLSEEQWLGF